LFCCSPAREVYQRPSYSSASACHPQPNPAVFLGPPQPAGAAEADTRDPRVISHLAAESDPDSARAAPPPSSPRARPPRRAHAARGRCIPYLRHRRPPCTAYPKPPRPPPQNPSSPSAAATSVRAAAPSPCRRRSPPCVAPWIRREVRNPPVRFDCTSVLRVAGSPSPEIDRRRGSPCAVVRRRRRPGGSQVVSPSARGCPGANPASFGAS
jgi:hypothetical protein